MLLAKWMIRIDIMDLKGCMGQEGQAQYLKIEMKVCVGGREGVFWQWLMGIIGRGEPH